MAAELVRMDLTAHRAAITAMADMIRSVYSGMAQVTGKPAYASAALATYQFSTLNGFADDFGDLISALETEMGGSTPAACPTDITNVWRAAKSGSFTPAEDVGGSTGDTYTITHNLGVSPSIVFVWDPSVYMAYSPGTSRTIGLAMELWVKNAGSADSKNFEIFQGSSGYTTTRNGAQYNCGFKGNVPTSTTAIINLATAALKAGRTYYWFVAALKS